MAAVEGLLSRMTLEEKVGQVMVVSFAGPAFSEEAERMVRDYHVGGVILFQQNLVEPAQIQALTGRLQAAAKVPLLVAVDQEGGPVLRVTHGATAFPSQMAVGATFSPEIAGQVARETARELLALGINTNFAPIVDVNSNPHNPVIGTRSYGADPGAVGRLATAAIDAQQRAGVLAVAKHFPGHGDADVDSHKALPVIPHLLTRLEATELPPFKAAIAAGVDGVMTAHLLLPALEPDPKRSATLSPAVLGYLRERLGFPGLIVTDDLEMGAIVNDHGTAEAAKLAFQAGADVLLFRRNVAEQQRAHGLLVEAVRRGEIPISRLDASARRVLEAKHRRGLLSGVAGLPDSSSAAGAARPATSSSRAAPLTAAGPPAGASTGSTAPSAGTGVSETGLGAGPAGEGSAGAAALGVARRSVTLVKNAGGILPLRLPADATVCVVYPKIEAVRGVEVMAGSPSAAPGAIAAPGPQTLGDAVRLVHPRARTAGIGFRPAAAEAEAARACVREAQAVIVGSYNLHEYPTQAALLQSLIESVGTQRAPAGGSAVPVVVVALRLPYDLAQLDAAPALVATYSHRPVALQVVAEALFGRGPAPRGHLPVPVEPHWPLGFGLLDWGTPDTVDAAAVGNPAGTAR